MNSYRLGSEIAYKFNLALKEVEKRKYLPSEIVTTMQAEGWDRFTMDSHTKLWKRLTAKDPAKEHCQGKRIYYVESPSRGGATADFAGYFAGRMRRFSGRIGLYSFALTVPFTLAEQGPSKDNSTPMLPSLRITKPQSGLDRP